MNALIEKLLQPVSATDPCGPDLFYDPRFEELEMILKGKPEIEIGSIVKPAEPPDWVELRSKGVEFLRVSKHLRPAVMLACALLKLEGISGFRDGLQLVDGLLEQYWKDIHPRLDPEDNNDPQARLNILSALTAPRGSATGWLQVIEYLRGAPLCQPKGVPPITLEALHTAASPTPAQTEGEGSANAPAGPTSSALATQFRGAPAAEITANHAAVQEVLETLKKLDQFLVTTLGTGGTINFDDLQKTLEEIKKTLAQYLPGPAGELAAEGAPAEGSGAMVGGGIAVSGMIRSRADVIRTLDHLCDYYRQIEPGSPVPFLLRRAQKLANMDFIQAMHELNLATADQLRPSLGTTVDTGAASA
ncbi:MAG TPA: type VI secretion system protein TssA [Verrucomicrobiae bacterium]|jgi:type VI secretion system protein ImpA|nr:type VI secretion system protein TssA [Verrucomicrobiae bacterium]